MKRYAFLLALCCVFLSGLQAQITQRDTDPVVDYSRTPHQYYLGDITVSGVKNYDDFLLIGLSGLQKGQRITIPGDEITAAIKRYWRHGLFSNVQIRVDSIVRDSAYLHIELTQRPRISEIRYNGVKKSEKDDLENRLGLVRENQMTPNAADRAKTLAKRYFDEKGYKNAEITITQTDDASKPDRVIVDVNVDKKSKVKVNRIFITGNDNLPEKAVKGSLLKKSVLKMYSKKGGMGSWFRSKKFTDKKYAEAKENLVSKYGELGFRDAYVVSDSVVPFDEKSVDIYLNVDEGRKYYVRNINWVGNTLYKTDDLNAILRMKRGDVYNQKHMNDRLSGDEDAIGNLYYNNGYVFYQLEPTEVAVEGDSIDLEMRIYEGTQAHIGHVRIFGNDRVYEHVVRRELRNKPGDLFSKESLERSYREIASMGNFDPEHIDPKVEPNPVDGTVDINWGLTPKSNDQIEFSLGYGQQGVIGKIGLKFSNFSIANLFNKNGLRRGVMPQGNGETFSISGQTNGQYYQAYSVSYMNPWFGGKRPNSLSVSAFFSKSTDVSERYYNSAWANSYNNYLYGYGNGYGSNNYYENFYDPDKYVKIWGASIGWGKRLRWPDDYFQLSADLSYTRYDLKSWKYFLISNGVSNNLAINFALQRNSTDNNIFPRRGSEFSFTVGLTPPYSLFDGKDYKNLANNSNDSHYQDQLQEKYRWIEYHKWKFRSRTFTPLTKGSKCLVLMTRVEFGLLGHYNSHKKSPFETFYVGGDGTSGYSSNYGTETIGLRGYDNGSLTPGGYRGYAYNRFTLELRYPLMLGNSTNLYALAFVEGGNAWNDIKDFNPLNMKRSAGVGARIFLPMVGLLGIDWAYGFDKVFGSKTYGGSQFHFILGQEF
ncbi:MAG: POTRA domain-containing protein [Bacteroidaceae bacterium]|nr:POTRA domain-containing protein [Prevotellaceae bacterium]MDY5631299.1 POTRA domain-containing protein [Bacteroidaceae bacterium]